MRERILYYALKYQGDWSKIAKAIAQNQNWEYVEYSGTYVTIVDKEYPEKLKKLQYAPWILFYEGNLSLCVKDCCAIIGSRNIKEESKYICEKITTMLSKRYVIVSGLAKGIDGCAHNSALHAGTIGVIGCGIDVVYPKQHLYLYEQIKRHHLLISEYPFGTKPLAHHFPWRNRILAALSEFVIVIEARCKSGTMLTVNEALTLGIPVYCVPQPFLYEQGKGCNLLISQGAEILVDMEDVKCLLYKSF